MASFIIDHSRIPAKRPNGTAVRLYGTGTSWAAGTTFTVSGVSGCSIATKIVVDATDAILVIVTGASEGALTVSDGTNSATLNVKNYRQARWGFMPDH